MKRRGGYAKQRMKFRPVSAPCVAWCERWSQNQGEMPKGSAESRPVCGSCLSCASRATTNRHPPPAGCKHSASPHAWLRYKPNSFTEAPQKRHSHIYSSFCKYHRNLGRAGHSWWQAHAGWIHSPRLSKRGPTKRAGTGGPGGRLLPGPQQLPFFPCAMEANPKVSRKRCQEKKPGSVQNTSPKRGWKMRKGSVFLQWKILEHVHSLKCPY